MLKKLKLQNFGVRGQLDILFFNGLNNNPTKSLKITIPYTFQHVKGFEQLSVLEANAFVPCATTLPFNINVQRIIRSRVTVPIPIRVCTEYQCAFRFKTQKEG
jgi:hypothetical protein